MSIASNVAEIRPVPLAQIQTEGGCQARVKIHAAVVADYAAAMQQQLADGGLRFPPVVLFTDGQTYWLGDGFHRVLAARKAKLTEIEADVHPGTQRDALLYSISANSAHGLPRTHADKRKAVNLLLADSEWNQWSDREIARRCQVSNQLVSRMRPKESVNQSGTRQRKAQRSGKIYQMSVPVSAPAQESATARICHLVTDAPPATGLTCSSSEALPGSSQAALRPLTDALGIPLPAERSQIFANRDRFREAKDLFLRLTKLIDQIAQSPSGEIYRQDLIRTIENGRPGFACPGLRTSLARLTAAEPHCCYCPSCQAAHPGRTNTRCKACAGRGWTTRAAYDACPQHEREQVLKLQPQTNHESTKDENRKKERIKGRPACDSLY